jgi:predicted DNA binding CopG/RHH family protein
MKKYFFLLPFALCLLLATCAGDDAPYNTADFAAGGPDAPLYNERTADFMQAENEYSNINAYVPKTETDKEINNNRWNTSRMETRWQEYKGTMVRVEILLGNTDLREMRLRLVQNADGMDIDGDMHSVLNRVADFEMKKVCGRNADGIVVVYDRPSFDVMRPTPYFDYRIEAEGASMREYGFRCTYRDL